MNEQKLTPISYTLEDVMELAETLDLKTQITDWDLFIQKVERQLSEYWYQEFVDTLSECLAEGN